MQREVPAVFVEAIVTHRCLCVGFQSPAWIKRGNARTTQTRYVSFNETMTSPVIAKRPLALALFAVEGLKDLGSSQYLCYVPYLFDATRSGFS